MREETIENYLKRGGTITVIPIDGYQAKSYQYTIDPQSIRYRVRLAYGCHYILPKPTHD